MPLSEKRWFRIMIGIIMFLLIIFLINLNSFILTPFVVLIRTIFLPFILAGILFYLCRPLVRLLEQWKVPNWLAILIVYIGFGLFFYIIGSFLGPILNEQLDRFINNLPNMVAVVINTFEYLQTNQNAIPAFLKDAIANYSAQFESNIQSNLGNYAEGLAGVFGVIGGLFNTLFYLVLVPFVLFYMLKDSSQFAPRVASWFPTSKRENVYKILAEMDRTIASYIQGQVFVSICVGVLLFIGYLIIGLNYSLMLALFGMFTNVIPFLGPYIAVIPAFLVALFQDPILALYVAIIMLVAQQIEGNIISPNVMGKTLKIHPLTIITLILTAGNLVGILGIIFVIPAYAVTKVLVVNIIKLYKLKEK
ncbi:AI-2E family transporter [Bacillus sp. Marseille-P3661]|uniref:AI-2E family transporter n=1 Tax=Bacillus sp. Marseille-P3661 TaxID=1936234 RepID=UPI000C866AC8|nr:AI-2E family transporter [Bacillus sp. Marseille-P3661]